MGVAQPAWRAGPVTVGVWILGVAVLLGIIVFGYRVWDAQRSARTGALLDAVLEGTSEGILIIDQRGRAVRSNAAARRLLGNRDRFATWTVEREEQLARLVRESRSAPLSEVEVRRADRVLLVSGSPVGEGRVLLRLRDVSEIRRLEKVRTDFVANASHELKTPLTALRGFAETLLDDEPAPEIRRRFVDSIHSNAIRLQNLVDDLLDLSRLESGGWRPELTPLLVGPVVEHAWETVVQGRGRSLSFSLTGEGIALADEAALHHVLRNLLDNALRHTADDGRIDVNVTTGPEMVSVAVADTGCGVPPEALDRIFERFYRVDPARSRQEGGTGLGLAIVSHMVTAMGGRVTAASEVGRGTTITFSLRRAHRPPPRHESAVAAGPAAR